MSSGASRRVTLAACTVLGALLCAAPALACPSCAVGIQARSDVWNQDFWFNLLVALLPFLVIGVACIYVEEREKARDAQTTDVDVAQDSPQSGSARHLSINGRIGS